MSDEEAWTLELADGADELPGWILVPSGMNAQQRRTWLEEASTDLAGTTGWDGTPLPDETTRRMLSEALAERAASESLAVLLAWPPLPGATATCHIDLLLSDAMPDWTETDAFVRATDMPHLGEGLQITTRRTVLLDGDATVDLAGVHLIFDDGQVTVLLSLRETLTALVSLALPGMVAVAQLLRVVRSSDGAAFRGARHGGLVDEMWPAE